MNLQKYEFELIFYFFHFYDNVFTFLNIFQALWRCHPRYPAGAPSEPTPWLAPEKLCGCATDW